MRKRGRYIPRLRKENNLQRLLARLSESFDDKEVLGELSAFTATLEPPFRP